MKKVINYIVLLVGGIMLSTLAACSDDDERTPSPTVDPACIGASFGAKNINFIELEDTDPTSITLEITRDKTDAAATVGIEVLANTDNIFTIPSNVSFAAGEAEKDLVISFDNAAMKKEYSFEIALENSAVNPYKGNSHASFTIQRLRWVNVAGECTFKDWVFVENAEGYKVSLQQVEGENRYRIVDPFKKGLEATEGDPANADDYLYFTIKPANKQVTFTSYETGYFNEEGLLITGMSVEEYMGIDDVDSKYNPATQTVTFNVYYYGTDLEGTAEEDNSGFLGQKESILELPANFKLVEEE